MTEIVFRGMTVNGKFVEGSLSILKNDLHYSAKIDKGCYISNSCGAPFAYQVRPDTVGQFTGLTDKNGKRVFEGDIMLLGDGTKRKTVIEYDSLRAQFVARLFDKNSIRMAVSFWSAGEVIGNIHDNHNLLEEK